MAPLLRITLLDLLDDALKLGLGAALGLIGAKLAADREWRKDKNSRRINSLETIAKDLGLGYQAVLDFSVEVKRCLNESEKPPTRHKTEMLYRSLMIGVDSKLNLLGYKDAIRCVHDYQAEVSNFIYEVQNNALNEAKVRAALRRVDTAKEHFFDALRAEYQRAERSPL